LQGVDCGYFDAGCGLSVFCGGCTAPLECGVTTANRCANPNVCTPEGWCWEHPLPQGGSLLAGFAFNPREVWLGTDTGSVLFWNGERTLGTTFPTQAGIGLRSIIGTPSREVFVSGEGGRIFRFDGTSWTREVLSNAVPNAILALHRGPTGVTVAAGSGGVLLQRNPVTRVWDPILVSPPSSPAFRRIHVAEPFVFAVSEFGQVYRGAIGSGQVSPIGTPPPAGFFSDTTGAAFSSDAGFVVLSGVATARGRAGLLDLRSSPPAWVPLVDVDDVRFTSVEVQDPRVYFSGERGSVAVVTVFPDAGFLLEGPLLPSSAPLFRSVIPVAVDEVILGGQSGLMGMLARDGGGWSISDNAFAQNRFETLNDGCAVPGAVAGSPVVHVTGAGNRLGLRSTRWQWQAGGSGAAGPIEWSRCHLSAQDQGWAVGNDRSMPAISRVSRRSGSTWSEVDTGLFSQQWTALSGFPDGTTYFLASGNEVLVNRDGGTTAGAFRRVTLDGGPLNDLVALAGVPLNPLQGAMNGANSWVSNASLTSWNWGGFTFPMPNDSLAIHAVTLPDAGYSSLAVGSMGLVVERRQGGGGGASRIAGVNDNTDVWVSRSLTAFIATTIDGGTAVGRTSASVIVRAPDGGTRLEPVPVSQRIRGLFGVDDLDGTTRVWATGTSGAILRKDFGPDGG
jgi:hypothetical protein